MRLRLWSRLRRRNRRAKRLIWKDRFEGQPFGIEQPLRVEICYSALVGE